jgi:hypothetical protein
MHYPSYPPQLFKDIVLFLQHHQRSPLYWIIISSTQTSCTVLHHQTLLSITPASPPLMLFLYNSVRDVSRWWMQFISHSVSNTHQCTLPLYSSTVLLVNTIDPHSSNEHSWPFSSSGNTPIYCLSIIFSSLATSPLQEWSGVVGFQVPWVRSPYNSTSKWWRDPELLSLRHSSLFILKVIACTLMTLNTNCTLASPKFLSYTLDFFPECFHFPISHLTFLSAYLLSTPNSTYPK